MGYPLLLSFNIFFRSWATPCYTGRYNIPWWAHPASQLQYIILLSSSASIYLLDHGPAPALQENMIFHSGPLIKYLTVGHPLLYREIKYSSGPPPALQENIIFHSGPHPSYGPSPAIQENKIFHSGLCPAPELQYIFQIMGHPPALQGNIIFHSGPPPASQLQYIFQVMGHPLLYRKI